MSTNAVFIGGVEFPGPPSHLYFMYKIFQRIGTVFENAGVECYYLVRENPILPKVETDPKAYSSFVDKADLVLVWNGLLPTQRKLMSQADALRIPTWFMELGWLPQTNTLYFDPKGINYESTLTEWNEDTPLNDEEATVLHTKLLHYQMNVARITGRPPEKEDFVFVPFQCQDDSQISVFSPHIKTMQQFVNYVCNYIPKGRIIFKTHPKGDPGEIKYPPRCELVKNGTTHDFLRQEKCKYVVTINSTVGVEALAYYKPVINVGQAFYGGRGLAYNALTDASMVNAVKWAEERKVARGKISAFLWYLLVKRQWRWEQLDEPERVLKLLEGVIGGQQTD